MICLQILVQNADQVTKNGEYRALRNTSVIDEVEEKAVKEKVSSVESIFDKSILYFVKSKFHLKQTYIQWTFFSAIILEDQRCSSSDSSKAIEISPLLSTFH